MLTLLLTLSLAQSFREPVMVTVSSRRVGGEQIANGLATQVKAIIERESGRSVKDGKSKEKESRACQGQGACLKLIAEDLGPQAVVVGIDAAKVGKSIAVHLEAMAADQADALAVADFLVPATKWQEASGAAVTVFARNVVEKLKVTPPIAPVANEGSNPKPSDSPKATPLEPGNNNPPPTFVSQRPQASSSSGQRTVGWLSVGVGVAGVATGGVLGLLALQDKSAVSSAIVDGTSTLPREQLEARAASGNAKFTGALISGIAGIALGVLGGVLLATD